MLWNPVDVSTEYVVEQIVPHEMTIRRSYLMIGGKTAGRVSCSSGGMIVTVAVSPEFNKSVPTLLSMIESSHSDADAILVKIENSIVPTGSYMKAGLRLLRFENGSLVFTDDNGDEHGWHETYDEVYGDGADFRYVKPSPDFLSKAAALGYSPHWTPGRSIWRRITSHNRYVEMWGKSTEDTLENMLSDGINEKTAAILLDINVEALRKHESMHETWLRGHPVILEKLSYEKCRDLRSRYYCIEDAALEIDESIKTLSKVFLLYGLRETSEQRGLLVSRQQEEYKKKTGHGSPAARQDVRDRIAETNLRRYGSENVFSSDYGKKIRETMRAKPPEELKSIHDSRLATINSRYGGNSAMCSPETVKKARKTWMSKYGTEYGGMSVPAIREKIESTNLKRYGARSSFGNENVRERCLDTLELRYGTRDPFEAGREKLIKSHSGCISKTNLRIGETISDAIPDATINYEVCFLNGRRRADLSVERNNKTVLIDLNPTVSHNSKCSYLCMIRGCYTHGCEKHGPGRSIDYHSSRALDERRYNEDFMQFYDWDMDEVVDYVSSRLSTVDDGIVVTRTHTKNDYSRYAYERLTVEVFNGLDADDAVNWMAAYSGSIGNDKVCYVSFCKHDGRWTMSMRSSPRINVESCILIVLREFFIDFVEVEHVYCSYSLDHWNLSPMRSIDHVVESSTGPVLVLSKNGRPETIDHADYGYLSADDKSRYFKVYCSGYETSRIDRSTIIDVFS